MSVVRLKRRLRCPKCRKAPRDLVEVTVVESSFAVLDDGAARDSAGYHEPGDITHVIAVCGCSHRWRIRGAIQVTGLDALADAPAVDCGPEWGEE